MNEQEIFSNSFGSVTDKSINVTIKGRVQSIPIKKVSSVSFERNQSKIMALVCFMAALSVVLLGCKLGNLGGSELLIIAVGVILFLLAGIANYIGNHLIRLNVDGKESEPIKVVMSKTKEGQAFYHAIRKQIVNQ